MADPNHSTQLRVLKPTKPLIPRPVLLFPNHSTQLRVLKLRGILRDRGMLHFQTTRLNWEYWNVRFRKPLVFCRMCFQTTRLNWEYWNFFISTQKTVLISSKPLDSTESTETSRAQLTHAALGASKPLDSTESTETNCYVFFVSMPRCFQTTRLNWEYWNWLAYININLSPSPSKPLDSTESTETLAVGDQLLNGCHFQTTRLNWEYWNWRFWNRGYRQPFFQTTRLNWEYWNICSLHCKRKMI